MTDRVAILGAGAWGTALAIALAPRTGVVLWARDAAQADDIDRHRCNRRYLPDAAIPETVEVTADFRRAAEGASLLIAAVPVAGLRELLGRAQPFCARAGLLWLCKGFEAESDLLPHQIVDDVCGTTPCGVLSGPSFAIEVARGLPCALTLASRDAEFARRGAGSIHGARLRVYFGTDVVGVEVGGAVKNVMAIAVGLSDGLGLGHNARAALITRGLAEIMRLGEAMGGRAETLMGLAGAGDLILTATGDLSRNRRVGLGLARGGSLDAVLAQLGHVAEGVRSAEAILRVAQRLGVDMPLTETVVEVLAAGLAPSAAVEQLLARERKAER